jgi:hypothetical protein
VPFRFPAKSIPLFVSDSAAMITIAMRMGSPSKMRSVSWQLYGVLSYNGARRRNEIGIWVALGTEQARALRMVMGEMAILHVGGLRWVIAALRNRRFYSVAEFYEAIVELRDRIKPYTQNQFEPPRGILGISRRADR